jgi:hypothetical protein
MHLKAAVVLRRRERQQRAKHYERALGATVDLYKIDHTYRVPVRID